MFVRDSTPIYVTHCFIIYYFPLETLKTWPTMSNAFELSLHVLFTTKQRQWNYKQRNVK